MSTQARLDFDPAPASPPAVDPHLPEALRRIQLPRNRALLARLLEGPIETDELERGRALYGKRGSARLHDVRQWIRSLGFDGDPIPRRCLDAERGLYEWAPTVRALELVREDMEARG